MTTAAELIRRAREAYSRDEPRDSTSSSDRQYTRGATGTPTGGQFATTAGTAQAKPKPTAKPVAKKPAPKATAKKAPTSLDQAMTRQYANFGSISAHTPAGDQRIKDMQALMAGLGIQVAQDGRFGPEMTAAAKQLQTKLGGKPTGRVTSSLFHKLQSAAILSPCARASEGVLFGAADLLRRAREGYNPSQLRADKGTGIGGRWVSMGAVVAALKGKGHHDAAASLSHLDGPSGGHHVPTHRPASHTPKIAHGGDRVKADRLHAEIGRLDEQHGARLHAGSAMLDPEARRQNRLKAHQLRGELAPVQARLDTEAAIKADNLETQGLIGDVPEGDHLAAARAHVASMQGGKSAAATPETGTGLPATPTKKLTSREIDALGPEEILPALRDGRISKGQASKQLGLYETGAGRTVGVGAGIADFWRGTGLAEESSSVRQARAKLERYANIRSEIEAAPAKPTAAAKVARATPTERRRQQRVDMLDKAIQDAASDPELSRAQVGGARSVVDGLRRIRDQIAEGRQGDEATVQDLNNAVQHRSLSGDSQRIMSDLIAEHARLAAEHRVPEPRPGAAAKVARAKAATPDPAETVAAMRSASSRNEAAKHLEGRSVSDLKAIAASGGIAVGPRDTKAKLQATIVQWTAGQRLDSEAISRPGPSSISPRKAADLAAAQWVVDNTPSYGTAEYHGVQPPTPAKPTAAQKMTRAKAAAPFSAPDVAATMRRLGNEDAIAQELQRVKATDLRALTDELNIKFPPQARTAAARKLYIAQTLAADNRRYHGGI